MLPERNSNLAYDLSHFEVDPEKEREREQDRQRRERELKLNKPSVSKSGSRFLILLGAAAVFTGFWMVNVQNTKVNDMARQVNAQKAALLDAQEENAVLQNKLDRKVNIGYIEQYAQNELGMQKITNSQINYLSVNTENLIEITPEDSGNLFTAAAERFKELLEYMGF